MVFVARHSSWWINCTISCRFHDSLSISSHYELMDLWMIIQLKGTVIQGLVIGCWGSARKSSIRSCFVSWFLIISIIGCLWILVHFFLDQSRNQDVVWHTSPIIHNSWASSPWHPKQFHGYPWAHAIHRWSITAVLFQRLCRCRIWAIGSVHMDLRCTVSLWGNSAGVVGISLVHRG